MLALQILSHIFKHFFIFIAIQLTYILGGVITLDKRCFQDIFLISAGGWLGVAKVSCILCHRGVQLILANSWTRSAILVAGKGRGRDIFISFVSSLSFLFLSLPCPSFSSPLLHVSLLSLFSISLGDDTK